MVPRMEPRSTEFKATNLSLCTCGLLGVLQSPVYFLVLSTPCAAQHRAISSIGWRTPCCRPAVSSQLHAACPSIPQVLLSFDTTFICPASQPHLLDNCFSLCSPSMQECLSASVVLPPCSSLGNLPGDLKPATCYCLSSSYMDIIPGVSERCGQLFTPSPHGNPATQTQHGQNRTLCSL